MYRMALQGAGGDALARRMQETVAAQAQPTLEKAQEERGENKAAATAKARRKGKSKAKAGKGGGGGGGPSKKAGAATAGATGSCKQASSSLGTVVQAEERAAQQGWVELPPELFFKVLDVLQEVGTSEPQEGGLGFCKAVAVVREVCAGWQAVHDAEVKRLVFDRQTTDEAVGMLVRRFPAVTSVLCKRVSPEHKLTNAGVLSLSSMPALTSLDLSACYFTDKALPALSHLNRDYCWQGPAAGSSGSGSVQAPRSTTQNPNLHVGTSSTRRTQP